VIKLTGLWVAKDKKGDQYFSGTLGGGKLLIFKNKHKEEDKHPDYILYIDEKKQTEDKHENNKKDELPF